MRPARDSAVVTSRLAETSEACRNNLSRVEHRPFQAGIHDVREALQRAQKQGVLTARELLDVADTQAGCRRLHRYFTAGVERFPLLKAQGMLLSEFPNIERAVDTAIAATGEVLDSATGVELQHARRRVRLLREEIRRETQRIINSPALQEPIITLRNGRCCVPVRAEAAQ